MPLGETLGRGRFSEVHAWDAQTALKLYVPQLPEAWADHERRATHYAWEHSLPVPAVRGSHRENGRLGLLLERLQGPTLLQQLVAQPLQVRRFAAEFARLHRQVHAISAADLPPLRTWVLSLIQASPVLSPVEKKALLDRAERLPDGHQLCHLDFHPGNVVRTPDGLRIIDWMGALRGSPLADIARTVLLFRHTLVPEGMNRIKRWIVGRLLREFAALHEEQCLADTRAERADLEAWLLPLAAARVSEPVSNRERASLLRYVRDTLG